MATSDHARVGSQPVFLTSSVASTAIVPYRFPIFALRETKLTIVPASTAVHTVDFLVGSRIFASIAQCQMAPAARVSRLRKWANYFVAPTARKLNLHFASLIE
jgi:hypothetical protein